MRKASNEVLHFFCLRLETNPMIKIALSGVNICRDRTHDNLPYSSRRFQAIFEPLLLSGSHHAFSCSICYTIRTSLIPQIQHEDLCISNNKVVVDPFRWIGTSVSWIVFIKSFQRIRLESTGSIRIIPTILNGYEKTKNQTTKQSKVSIFRNGRIASKARYTVVFPYIVVIPHMNKRHFRCDVCCKVFARSRADITKGSMHGP